MSAITGGVAAAAGLGFQYLAAIDELLSGLEESDDDFTLSTEDPVDDVIDYGLRDSTGAFVHSSTAMTPDIYADLFDGDLDAVSDALDNAVSQSNVGKMWAEPEAG